MASSSAIELLLPCTLVCTRPRDEPDQQRSGSGPDRSGGGDPPAAVCEQHKDNGGRAENGETYGGGDPGPGSKSLSGKHVAAVSNQPSPEWVNVQPAPYG